MSQQTGRRIQTRRTTEPGEPVSDEKWQVLADTGPIALTPPADQQPQAKIVTPSDTVAVNQTVSMDGSQSTGSGQLTYSWTQPRGTTVTLNPSAAHQVVSFTAPLNTNQGVPIDHTLGFQLTVKDASSGKTASTTQDVKVSAGNQTGPPSQPQQPPPPDLQPPQEPPEPSQDPTTSSKPTPILFTADVINHSTKISNEELQKICDSVKKQMDQDLSAYWSYSASFNFGPPVQGNVKLGIFDSADEPGDFGWHSATGDQVTIEVFYVGTYEDLCITISHEMVETIADYDAKTIVDGFDEHGKPVKAYLEIADPVESDSYSVDNIKVSNFATPTWFGMPPHGGTPDRTRTDFMQITTRPWDIAKGGYMQYSYDNGQTWQDVHDRIAFDALSGSRKAKRAKRLEEAEAEAKKLA